MYQDTTRNLTPSSTSTRWNRSDDKLFEKALVIFPDHLPDRWQSIAEQLGRSVEEVKEHYEILVHDVFEIDAGRVALPNYADDDLFESSWDSQMTDSNQISFSSSKSKQIDPERKKGTPWTPQEHKLFLIGLKQYGKGDWRSISRNVVVTRTPTQVASHAQKYFLRQNSVKKERKRSSIHDITTVAVDNNNNNNNSVNQNWIAPPPQSSVVLPNQGPPSMDYQNYGFPN